MSVELYLAINLMADLALLGTVSRMLGVFNRRRIFTAAAFCAAYAVLAATHPTPWTSPALQSTLIAVAAALVSGTASVWLWGTTLLAILCAALVCGGIASVLGSVGLSASPLCLCVGLAAISLLYAIRPPARECWEVRIGLAVGDETVCFPALIDTGNRLREPRSGMPVLIAEATLVENVFPKEGNRLLHFGAVGGEGILPCFKPTAVWLERDGRRRRAPEVWVAASPTPLPGPHRALAPPEFALYRI